MRVALLLVTSAVLAGCSIGENIAFKSTSKIIAKAQPSMQMESDYELARQAIPGSLKTVEGFWVAGPPESARKRFEKVLTEGYCQYKGARRTGRSWDRHSVLPGWRARRRLHGPRRQYGCQKPDGQGLEGHERTISPP